MRAIIFAAGVGARLGDHAANLPKVLLRFAGQSLLERHIRILRAIGIDDVVVGTGFGADLIAAEIARLGAGGVRQVHNPEFRLGSIVTQWALRRPIVEGGEVVLMDADVLYDQRLLRRLVESAHGNCFLLDRNLEPGEEPVKLCVKDGFLVDFRKRPERAHDWYGESVGFFRLTEATARRLVKRTGQYLATGRTGEYYDEALRDLLIGDPPGHFGFEDITGLPWTEIDFADDVIRAEREILPLLEALER